METAPLKSFAAWARTALIREVAARIAVVLAPASPERVEQRSAVAALEKAVNATGGGDTGRSAVADKVAYTWFNRIIALRFMDANGYTGIGVVSPERGREGGQPEILAEAKRGNIDSTVVTNKRTVETVTTLLNGTRRSDDPQGEAYSLLLAEYCRHWNRSMPFMFEREGDYTELLIPANLLADDSVLARVVTVLTEDVCQDVEVIGWLYQFYISERKDEVFAGFKKNKKAGAAEIPAATQLFTPHWIVRYLVENSLGRLWLLNRPTSRVADQMDYYIAQVDEETDYLKVSSPEELKIIDPACGSGHMLTYAFDLLYAIYEEEGYAPSDIPGLILEHNLYGAEVDPRAGALAAFALTMKARARQRTFFNKRVVPNVCVLEPVSFTSGELDVLATPGGDRAEEDAFWNQFRYANLFGSLIRPCARLTGALGRHLDATDSHEGDLVADDLYGRARRVVRQAEYLSRNHSVAIANPPYMGTKNMDARLAEFSQRAFADSKSDLFAMFIERCRDMTAGAGYVAMITMQSWMFLKSYERLRERLLAEAPPVVLAHLGERAFDSIGGSVVSTAAFVLQRLRGLENRATYHRLVDGASEAEKARLARGCVAGTEDRLSYRVAAQSFGALPGSPLAYWFPTQLLAQFAAAPPLSSVARAAKGLVTADNAYFVREWWEVSRGRIGFGAPDRERAAASRRKWFPYAKGGDFRRWAGNLEAVVNWERDGHELQTTLTADGSRVRATNFNLDRIFKPGISWTVVTTSDPSFRAVGPGFLFADAAGMCQSKDDDYLLALLNSSSVGAVLNGLNPTLNLHPGYLGAVPAPADAGRDEIQALARRAVELSTADWNLHERSWDFQGSPLVGGNPSLAARYAEVRAEWASWVDELRGIEEKVDGHFAGLYGLHGTDVTLAPPSVSLGVNTEFSYPRLSAGKGEAALHVDAVRELVSYGVGCMFGRFSLDEPGLILADRGDTLQDFLAKVPNPSFMPDKDNVIPIVDGDWFEDDIVARFRQFLRAAFGEQHFEENLRFVVESLGVKDLRDYFVKSFYMNHAQRYKKRPVYWMFSSPKGSFNALIYMHRYTPSTASTVLNEYLREYKAKLEASRQHHGRLAAGSGTAREKAAAQKEVDRLRKVLLELDEYEHDVLYPLATQQVHIDLDDGVKANYLKLGAALKKIPGLEASND